MGTRLLLSSIRRGCIMKFKTNCLRLRLLRATFDFELARNLPKKLLVSLGYLKIENKSQLFLQQH